ncbi:hypothetical protein N7532_004393 [Penicillium argentinense]|uniref:ferric-chelate reductase (NADPH) n=1 Tax=Penicillium argentinense TaxID=1131581 RepID=A0A9W9FPE6_9EURO|nr:uncharacterized protein N7532_004393 [Penicillium argentinense]KAJ5103864.1 hypothetical protein N7532_004393 [Penicillium argentinense]
METDSKMSSKEVRLAANIGRNKYFAITFGAIMVVFIACYWYYAAYMRFGSRSHGPLMQKLLQRRRAGARFLSKSTFGLHRERWILYLIYWAVNLILALTDVDLTNLKYVAKRFGWMSVANFVLLVFLALKNTLLAPLSGHSYEKLRPLHKTAGYTCIVTTMLHASIYLSSYGLSGDLDNMRETSNIAGGIAGLAMVIIGFSTITWLARNYYEAFYAIHISMFFLIIVMVGMHRPDFATSTLIIIIFTACLWLADRLLRLGKLCWNYFGNYATITPMADGAVRVKLHRRLPCTPGSHAFLWMPSIRVFETHPFTLVSADPAEFLIRQYNGYTRSLYKAAQAQPGKVIRCSVDGPYGQVPDFMNFDRVILIAGGSGATFTISIALNMIRDAAAANVSKTVDFIWAVKHSESLRWFEQELQELQDSSRVNFLVYVSRDDPGSDSSSLDSTGLIGDLEKSKEGITGQTIHLVGVRKGRPDIPNLVAYCISQCGIESRIGVGACGPAQMIKAIRETVSKETYDKGPSTTLHTEVSC